VIGGKHAFMLEGIASYGRVQPVLVVELRRDRRRGLEIEERRILLVVVDASAVSGRPSSSTAGGVVAASVLFSCCCCGVVLGS